MLKNMEGQSVPHCSFPIRVNNKWTTIESDKIFKGKKVVLFALPGAFTPTCSSNHLPRFNELAPVFKENGVDDIICLSVNDPFVMEEWQKNQGANHIHFIPDGNGVFSEGMGMLVDKSDLGFGKRSWRYSMFVDDGIIKKMFIEPEVAGDPFEISDADTMLKYLAPTAQLPKAITIFSKPGCSHCHRALELLKKADLPFEEIVLGKDATYRSLAAVAGAHSTPQIFIQGVKIGGADDLEEYLALQT